ncbi:MAG: Maf family protein [Candidatus Micrarchaeota archaeon]|nr:Maf family protein [Candidatus Micrarchaeota archaeon]
MRNMGIVLASASPRRKRLLSRIVRQFKVENAKICERIHRGEPFPAAAIRLAQMKAEKVAKKHRGAVVIGADTIAYLGRRIFAKTKSRQVARRALSFLSGKTHFVATGVCVLFPSGRAVKYCEKAAVKMKRLDKRAIGNYLKTGEWRGRAGSYDISGKGKGLVESVRGERETVVGLPLKRLKKILRQHR